MGDSTQSGGPVIVREEEAGRFGLYRPEEHVIETYTGDEREEVSGEHYGEAWHDASEEELRASIEADIEDVLEDVEALEDIDLTDEQRDELARLRSRLESMENTLDLFEEVRDAQ